MTCTVYKLDGPPQTGKTTIVAGALRLFEERGKTTLLISHSSVEGKRIRSRYGLRCRVESVNTIAYNNGWQMDASVVAIDPADFFTAEMIHRITETLDGRPYPTTLLIAGTF
jgi:thymidine kinase